MGEPNLTVVDPDDMDRCGAECDDGSPCGRKTGGDLCWQHEDEGEFVVEAPDHLGEHGEEEWKRRVKNLASAGVLGQADLGLLEQACEMYEEARRCQKSVQEHGHLVPGQRGKSLKKNPASAKHIKYRKEYRLSLKDLAKQIDEAGPSKNGRGSDPLSDMADF